MKPIVPPPIVGPSEFSKAVMESLKGYESTWLDRVESENFSQKHDEELARGVVRPTVEEEVRKQVDAMLEDQLANFKKQLAGAGKGKKAGKVHTLTLTLTHTHTHACTYTRARTRVHVRTCTPTCTHIYIRTRHVYTDTHIHHAHTDIHTSTRIFTCLDARWCYHVSVYSMY